MIDSLGLHLCLSIDERLYERPDVCSLLDQKEVPAQPNNFITVSRSDDTVTIRDDFDSRFLRNALSSGHLNVLLGSGFSCEVVPTLGCRESWFCEAANYVDRAPEGASGLLKLEYFSSVMRPLEYAKPTLAQVGALNTFMHLVRDRGTATIPRRINLFTTNYDPLIERSLEMTQTPYNDGFVGRERPTFSSSSYSRLQCEQSLFMEYTMQVATANVIKPHGSLTWKRSIHGIEYACVPDVLASCVNGCESILELSCIADIQALIKDEFSNEGMDALAQVLQSLTADERSSLTAFESAYDSTLCIVNPTKRKFEETLLEQSYYDLLRIYANELDRNNAVLLVFGFSFADEHIRDLTIRAAQSNPKLLIIVSCYELKDAQLFADTFASCDNVILLAPEKGKRLDLETFARGIACLTR